MSTTTSVRRSSFGMRCAHCNNALIAPEWTEERSERQIHVWRCWKCDFYFETVVYTKVTGDSTTTGDASPSRLVAQRNGVADFRRVAAVDGNALDLVALAASGVTAPGIGEHYTRGALGCALSHFALWDQAVATNQITTVCEDDVISAMNGLDYPAR